MSADISLASVVEGAIGRKPDYEAIFIRSESSVGVTVSPNLIEFRPAATGKTVYASTVIKNSTGVTIAYRVGQPKLSLDGESVTGEAAGQETSTLVPVQIWPREGTLEPYSSALVQLALCPQLEQLQNLDGKNLEANGEVSATFASPLTTVNNENTFAPASTTRLPSAKKPNLPSSTLPEITDALKMTKILANRDHSATEASGGNSDCNKSTATGSAASKTASNTGVRSCGPTAFLNETVYNFVVPFHCTPTVSKNVKRQRQLRGVIDYDEISEKQRSLYTTTLYLQVVAPCVSPILAVMDNVAKSGLLFGQTIVGERSRMTCTLCNLLDTRVQVRVSGLSPLGPFYLDKPWIVLEANGSAKVSISFIPDYPKSYLRMVEFAVGSTSVSVKLFGEGVVPSVVIEPTSHSIFMGDLVVGESSLKSFKIYNTSQIPVQCSISIVQPPEGGAISNCNSNGKDAAFTVAPSFLRVLPDERQLVQVRFSPDRESLSYCACVRVSVLGLSRTFEVKLYGKCWANSFYPAGFDLFPASYREPVSRNSYVELVSMLKEQLELISKFDSSVGAPKSVFLFGAGGSSAKDEATVEASQTTGTVVAPGPGGVTAPPVTLQTYKQALIRALKHFNVPLSADNKVSWKACSLFESGKGFTVNGYTSVGANGSSTASSVPQSGASSVSLLGSLGSSVLGVGALSGATTSLEEFLSVVPQPLAMTFLKRQVTKVRFLTLSFPWVESVVAGVRVWQVQVQDSFVLNFAKPGTGAPAASSKIAGEGANSKKAPVLGEFTVEKVDCSFCLDCSGEYVLENECKEHSNSGSCPFFQLQPLKGTVELGSSRPFHISVATPIQESWQEFGKRREQWYLQPPPSLTVSAAEGTRGLGKARVATEAKAESAVPQQKQETARPVPDAGAFAANCVPVTTEETLSETQLTEGTVLTQQTLDETLERLAKPATIPKAIDLLSVASMPAPSLIETVYMIKLNGGQQVSFPKGFLPLDGQYGSRVFYLKLRADPSLTPR